MNICQLFLAVVHLGQPPPGRCSGSSAWHLQDQICSIVSSFGISATSKTLTYHSTLQWKAIQTVRGPETRTYKRRLGEAGLFSLKNSWLKGNLIAVQGNYVGGYREDEARVFLKVHRDRARDNKHKLEHGKFQYQDKLFHHKGDEAVEHMPRGHTVSSLGRFRT